MTQLPSSFTPESDRHGAKSGAEFGPEFAPASNPTAGTALNPADPVGYEYQVGGSLPAYSPTYVQRQGDLDLYTKIKASQFCYVFNSRQMGKSSLRVRTMERLRQDGIACAALELSQIGSQQIKPETWYAGFIRSVIFSLRGGDAAGERAVRSLRESFNLRTWWRERDWLPPVQRFTEFLETVLLCAVPSQIVIFVDEIDSVLRLPFKDDFFAVLRSCYNCRSDRPELRRLSFVLLGVAAPASLIQDKSRTPFNIGHAIDLTGFQPGEIGPLQAGWTCEQDLADRLGAAVLAWTGGQPFLTQKVCHWIAQALPQDPHPSPLPGGEGTGDPHPSPLPGGEGTGEDRVSSSPRPLGEGPGVRDLLRPLGEGPGVREPEVWVAQLIQTRLLENWENQDEPQHLRTIRDRLLLNEAKAVKLLGLYEQILIQGSIQADDSLEQIELRLSGLVVQRWGQLRVYNRVYAWVFDRAWVQESLAHLRPEFYGQALGRWLAQPEGDPKALLQGQDLQGAQQWAAGKQLSIGDYRFLAACQEAEVRRILATAEQQAKWTVYRGFSTLLAMAAMAIMGVLWSGYAVQQAQQVTEIERQTQQALQQFEFKQLESLLLATRSARTLAELFDPDRPPATYPTLSPLLALQQILSTVREQNQIRGHQGPVVTVAFSPDGQRILTGSQDGTAKLWSLQGELLATLDPTLACDEALGCPATPDLATPSSQAVPPPSPLTDPLPAAISATTPAVPPAISPPATPTLAPDRNPPATPATPPLPQNSAPRDLDPASTGLILPNSEITGNFFNRARSAGDSGNDRGGSRERPYNGDRRNSPNINPNPDPPRPKSAIVAVAYAPNGHQMAIATDANEVHLWDDQGRWLSRVTLPAAITDVAFRPESLPDRAGPIQPTLAIATVSGDVFLAQLTPTPPTPDQAPPIPVTTTKLDPLNPTPPTAPVTAMAWSADGQGLVRGFADGRVAVWWADRNEGLTWDGRGGAVEAVAWAGDAAAEQALIATGNQDGTVKLWTPTGQAVRTLSGHKNPVLSLAFDATGETLASASADRTIRLWNRAGETLAVLQGHQDRVEAVQFQPRGAAEAAESAEVTESDRTKTNPFAAASNTQAARNTQPESDTQSQPQGPLLVSASQDHTVRLWNLEAKGPIQTFQAAEGSILAVQFTPDGRGLVTAGSDRLGRVWDRLGNPQIQLQGHTAPLWEVQVSPKGRYLVTASSDGTARLWNSGGQPLQVLTEPQGEVLGVAMDPTEQYVATAGSDGTARLWNLQGQEVAVLTGHQSAVWDVAFNRSGDRLATASADQTVRLWNLKGETLAVLKGHQSRVWQVRFNPAGDRLATVSDDGTARLWDLQGNLRAVFEGHQGAVRGVSFSPTGNLLATAGEDGTVRLWELRGRQVAEFQDLQQNLQKRLFGVSFSPDGRALATAAEDGTVRLWAIEPLDLPHLLHRSCTWLQPYLNNPNSGLLPRDRALCRNPIAGVFHRDP